MNKFPWWPYIRIELEIQGSVAESRYVQNKDYQKILNLFIAYGKAQPCEYAIFVKRHVSKSRYTSVKREEE